LWPDAGLTRSLHLKRLCVAGACRRQRIGKLLIDARDEIAAGHHCRRVKRATGTDNPWHGF
jgi:hypothetical protein